MDSGSSDTCDEQKVSRVKLQKNLNVASLMSMIVGSIVGSGIFISPKGVLLYTGSFGLNLIVWFLCGLISMGGSLCYVELATRVRESGGEWAYIKEGMGSAPAFLAAWMNMILISSSCAAILLASCEYLLSSLFTCGIPTLVLKTTGLALLWMAIQVNTSVKLATKVMKVLLCVKVLALTMIVVGGIYWLTTRGTANLGNAFEGTDTDGWKISLAFYSGLWAFEGWNVGNFATEEVKNVKSTMTKAVLGSTLLTTCLYLAANVSYYAILTPQEILTSDAVAVDWARNIIGNWSGLIGILVALSTFGSVIASFFGSSRVLMAVAREGHTVELLSMVDVKDGTPLISVYWRGFLTAIFMLIGDISVLIDFFSFSAWMFYALSFTSLIIIRYRTRNVENSDVFKVPILIIVLMLLTSAYLIVVPIIAASNRLPFLFAGMFMLSGLILYLPFVFKRIHIQGFQRVTLFCQMLCRVGLPDKDV